MICESISPLKWIKNGSKNRSQKVIIQVDQCVNADDISCIPEGRISVQELFNILINNLEGNRKIIADKIFRRNRNT